MQVDLYNGCITMVVVVVLLYFGYLHVARNLKKVVFVENTEHSL